MTTKLGEVSYWFKCEKCHSAIVSRTAVVCHQCATGKRRPLVKSFSERLMEVWDSGPLSDEMKNTVIMQSGERTIKYRDIHSFVVDWNGGVRITLHDGLEFGITSDGI